MNKQLLATFITLSTINFFSTAYIQPAHTTKSKQPNKTQLLNHLKNVKSDLQKNTQFMLSNWQNSVMYIDDSESVQDAQERAEMALFFNLTEDFYKSSPFLQEKVSEMIDPVFNFICNNIKHLNMDEISRHINPHAAATIDRETRQQLQMLFQSLYTKHYKICRNSNPNVEITQVPVNELFEQCFHFILFPYELFIYGSKTLLQKLDAKIKKLEQA